MEITIKVECKMGWNETISTEVMTLTRRTAALELAEVGLTHAEGKAILKAIQQEFVKQQVHEYSTFWRICPDCLTPQRRKDVRTRQLANSAIVVSSVTGRGVVMDYLNEWRPRVLSLLRIMAALLYLQHGLMKMFHFPAPQPGVGDPLPPLLIAAALIELIGGGLIAIGLFTRPAAFICSGMMAVGYFMSHAPTSFWPGLNGGEPAILFCFIFFYLVFAGAGSWSVDAWRTRGASA